MHGSKIAACPNKQTKTQMQISQSRALQRSAINNYDSYQVLLWSTPKTTQQILEMSRKTQKSDLHERNYTESGVSEDTYYRNRKMDKMKRIFELLQFLIIPDNMFEIVSWCRGSLCFWEDSALPSNCVLFRKSGWHPEVCSLWISNIYSIAATMFSKPPPPSTSPLFRLFWNSQEFPLPLYILCESTTSLLA